ncbi:spore germination protein GerPC [Paenibacillus sedimenti]|uniref:Uncharacterized protein n=1 Tax=Paenibacillus sedimenti TaxID=2770274 RepID=A0A926KWB4_9BACL|nr:spore germination protein GerPC [Paenibacillus sedimenti]MBD0384081.1 hypothetical protein [Paenibacillus sedimenti]
MYDPYKQYQYLLQIEQRMRQLETSNQLLEQEIRRLKENSELDSMKLKEQLEQIKPIHIENINYKIQELAVKDLKGTLNIGLTALTDEEQLKKIIDDVEQGKDIQFEDLNSSPGESDPNV